MKLARNVISMGLGVAFLVGASGCSGTAPAESAPPTNIEQTPETVADDRIKTGSQPDIEDPLARVPSVDLECGEVTMLSTLEFRVGLREAQGTASPEELARESADLQDLVARVSPGKTPISPHLRAAKKHAEDGNFRELKDALGAARNACSANGSMTYIMASPGESG